MKWYNKHIGYFAFLLLLATSCSSNDDEDRGTKKQRGEAIIETGEVAAVNYKSFPLARFGRQFWEMKLIGLLEHGAIVQEGDSVIQLDPTDVNKMIVDQEANLETELATLQTLKINQENQISAIESNVKTEMASFNLKKIELESTRFEAEKTKRIKQLEFQQAEIRLQKEKSKRELNKIIMKNELHIQEVRVAQVQNQIKSAYDILPKLTVRTEISGVFQVGRSWRNGLALKVGDAVYPGQTMGSVPELKWMKIETHVGETDFLKIHVGQKVAVRLDAMPDVVFDGEVAYIGKLCKKKEETSREKIFDVEVTMLSIDPRLKPGMTVSCEYLD